MDKPYTKSRLWNKAFSGENDISARRLADQYGAAWDRACSIANGIRSDALGLTLHDERHFSALWEAADLLVPPELKLTPVETFVFGVAILIHDAAHTTLAYEGGLQELSKTPEWADNLVSRLEENPLDQAPYELTDLPEHLKRLVLFDTVRALHAKQAIKVLALPFKHPSFGSNIYLIDDPTIRNHMGEIIGQIAASHHWDLADVSKLPRSLNVTSPYHGFGPIRPILLAALMRTSDAIQIDNSRAPDFEFALSSPSGVSLSHWTAQNKLAKGVDPFDSTALSINSTASFLEAEAPAWWIAYDLAKVADRELRNTAGLLRDYAQPRLSLLGVKDVSDPTRFANHVKTEGWHPVSAEVTVGDTARLIELLGGKGLYGHDVAVPVRELIQNAVDAVRARRLLDKGFGGKITVELVQGLNSAGAAGYWLRVTDDGIGMSPAILTGPFIIFGESGWSSSAFRRERPGFTGRRFGHIGKFGIGFFSVFMIGDEVRITSRPFDAAKSTTKLLHFSSGLGLRPLVKDFEHSAMNVVTSVEVFVDTDTKRSLMHRHDERLVYEKGRPPTRKPIEVFSMVDLVGMICPAIDVEIEAFDSDSGIRASIKGDWHFCDGEAWIRRITGLNEDPLPKAITENIGLMALVSSRGVPTSRASLNPSPRELGVYTVGGLTSKKIDGRGSPPNFIGSLDRAPLGPRREPGRALDNASVATWATEQVRVWAQADLSPQEQNFIAANACFFGGDPLPLANAQIDGEWYSVAQIYNLLLNCRIIRAPISSFGLQPAHWSIMKSVNLPSGFLYHPEDIEVELRNVMLAGASADVRSYWSIPNKGPPQPESLLGSLGRFALAQGKHLELNGTQEDYGYYNGPTIRRELRTNGDRIVLATIELRLVDQDVVAVTR